MTPDVLTADPLAGYLPEAEMAKSRKVTPRTLRAERQRGDGPPYVKDGKKVFYPIDGFRAWLKGMERHPVRGPGVKVA
jgi:hypothetical protein